MSYNDLINIDDFEKKETFNQERWWVDFYCKTCKSLVETTRPNPEWYTFICKKCWGKEIVIWTKEWLINNYRIKK